MMDIHRKCDTCAFDECDGRIQPCISCHAHEKWTAPSTPLRACETCAFADDPTDALPCADCGNGRDKWTAAITPLSGLIDSGVEYPAETIRKAAIHARICQSMNDTYKRKNADYGDSFCKLRRELPSAILVRIYDKYSRLKNLVSGAHQHVSDESVKDTLMDLANYCVMELVEMEEVPHGD